MLPEQRDDALSVVMRRFTINPQFKSIHSMRTLATTDKELWRIWKDAIPHMKMKLPQHTHSYLICMFENNVEPDNFIRTEMSIYGNPTPIYTDSWGQPSMFWSDYNNLTQTQQNELKAKIKKDKYERIIMRILDRAQIGDMFYMYNDDENRYVIVDEPSKETSCVIKAPCFKVDMMYDDSDATTYVYLLPAECTNFLIKHGIVPLASKTPLVVPPIRGQIIDIPSQNVLDDYDDLQNLPIYKYCKRVGKNKLLQMPDYNNRENLTMSQLILYQHPENLAMYFDSFGTIFSIARPRQFQRARPSKIAELRSQSA